MEVWCEKTSEDVMEEEIFVLQILFLGVFLFVMKAWF